MAEANSQLATTRSKPKTGPSGRPIEEPIDCKGGVYQFSQNNFAESLGAFLNQRKGEIEVVQVLVGDNSPDKLAHGQPIQPNTVITRQVPNQPGSPVLPKLNNQ